MNLAINIRHNDNGQEEIFDPWRKKYVRLTPEEWIRQQFLRYLVKEKSYPASLIAVEKGITVNRLKKRYDAVVYDRRREPLILIEFKAPGVKLTQKVIAQAAAYNLELNVSYLIVSNGNTTYCVHMDSTARSYSILKDIPPFEDSGG